MNRCFLSLVAGSLAATPAHRALSTAAAAKSAFGVSVWIAARYNVVFLGGVGVVFVALAGPIVSLFSDDPAVASYAVNCLRIVGLGFPFYAYGMVLNSAFNGAGDTWTPTWINFLIFWLLEIPLAYALAVSMNRGPRGVFIAITIAYSSLAVVSAYLFRKGRWKTKQV